MSSREHWGLRPSRGSFFCEVDETGCEHGWYDATLWKAAEGLPVEDTPLESLEEYRDRWEWLDDVLAETARMEATDLSFPIIRSSRGHIMDGYHRLAKALLRNDPTIRSVRFTTNPPPDWKTPSGQAEGSAKRPR